MSMPKSKPKHTPSRFNRWIKSLGDQEVLYVSPAIAQWLIEDAEREGRKRPRLTVTDYSKLRPCCPGRQEEPPW